MIAEIGSNILRELNRINHKLNLNPGLSEKYFHEKIKNFPISLPNILMELYSWKNGVEKKEGNSLNSESFIPGFIYLTFEESMGYYLEFCKDEKWNKYWFPLFSNGGGDFYVIDVKKNKSNNFPIIGFMLGESDHEIEYHNLTSMFITVYECYKRDIYYLNNDGFLDVKSYEEVIVSNVLNPGLPRWESELN